jgi:hypothetical protein
MAFDESVDGKSQKVSMYQVSLGKERTNLFESSEGRISSLEDFLEDEARLEKGEVSEARVGESRRRLML